MAGSRWINYLRQIRLDVKDEVPDGSHWTFVTSAGGNLADRIVEISGSIDGVYAMMQHGLLSLTHLMLRNRPFLMCWPPKDHVDRMISSGTDLLERPVRASDFRRVVDTFMDVTSSARRVVFKDTWCLINFDELDAIFPGCLKFNISAAPLFRAAALTLEGRRWSPGAELGAGFFEWLRAEVSAGRMHDERAARLGAITIRPDLIRSIDQVPDLVQALVPDAIVPPAAMLDTDHLMSSIEMLNDAAENDLDVMRFSDYLAEHDPRTSEWIKGGPHA